MGDERRPQVPDLNRIERGSFTVEAALVIPVIVMVVLAVAEVVAVVTTHLELVAAVREGARVAATTPEPEAAVRAVRQSLPPPVAERVRVSVVRPSVVGRPAIVEVSYRRPLVTPFLERVAIPLSARAVMRVER